MGEIELSETLKNLRKQQNLSQEALADLLHVSRQSLSKWERGEATPDIYSLNKLANLYKISLDDLVNGNIKDSKLVSDVQEPFKQEEVKRPNFNIYITILGILTTIFCATPYSLIARAGVYFLDIEYFYISFWVLISPIILFIRLLKSNKQKDNYYFTLYLVSFICSIIVLIYLSNYTLIEMYSVLIILSIVPILTYILSHTKATYRLELVYKNSLLNVFTFAAIAF